MGVPFQKSKQKRTDRRYRSLRIGRARSTLGAPEDVRAQRDNQVIRELVSHLQLEEVVVVRRAVERDQGQPPRLVFEQLVKTQRGNAPAFNLRRKSGGKRIPAGGILLNGFNGVLDSQRGVLPEIMLYVIGTDHSIPNSVSLKQYREFVRRAKILGSYT